MQDYRFPNQRAIHTYRGGRKKRDEPQWTWFIRREDALEIINASMFAVTAEVPINAHVTVNFSDAVSNREIPKIVATTLKNYRQWLRRRGYNGAQTTHIWVREHPAASHAHVHILLHVPGNGEVRLTNRLFARFLPPTALIDATKVRKTAQDHSGAPIILKQKEGVGYVWARYVLKGIARTEGLTLGLDRIAYQGSVLGKRVGVAENIGKTERSHWNDHVIIWGVERARANWRERAAMPRDGSPARELAFVQIETRGRLKLGKADFGCCAWYVVLKTQFRFLKRNIDFRRLRSRSICGNSGIRGLQRNSELSLVPEHRFYGFGNATHVKKGTLLPNQSCDFGHVIAAQKLIMLEPMLEPKQCATPCNRYFFLNINAIEK